MVSVLRPGQRHINIPAIGVQTSRRAVSGGNGLLNNLVAYWPLNEAAGANNALDLHTNGLTLTQVSSPGSAAGIVYSGARTFNGSSQYFTRASESLLQTGDIEMTVAAWVYLSNKTAVRVVCGKRSATVYEWQISYQNASDRFLLGVSNNGGVAGGLSTVISNSHGSVALDTWILLIAWHDPIANQINISVNNGTADSATHNSGVFAGAAPVRVGDFGAGNFYWNGRIGPVAMWKSAAGGGGVLTAAQRTALWNAGAGLPYASFTV